MTQFILYSLAFAADAHGVEINAFCAMSTHIHMVVTDPNGVLPRFLRCFHHLVAMGTKILRRWSGPVWDHARTSVVELLTPQAIVEKIAYTLANPVSARVVEYAHQWPGAKNLVADIGGKPLQIGRPTIYFDPKKPRWTPNAIIEVRLPPMIAAVDLKKFQHNIAKLIVIEEAKARKKAPKKSNATKHRAAIISPYKRATSREPERKRNLAFAAGHGNADVCTAATSALQSFHVSYRRALEQWRAGDRNVRFPKGTWWMREFHGANVQ